MHHATIPSLPAGFAKRATDALARGRGLKKRTPGSERHRKELLFFLNPLRWDNHQ
jgi:hypothetical protein